MFDRIIDAIERRRPAVVERFLDERAIDAMRDRASTLEANGAFEPARIRGAHGIDASAIRGDRICWLDTGAPDPSELSLLRCLDGLRVELNRVLQLGLLDLEAHYALYAPGALYARHLDRFRDDDARALSIVLYLNGPWAPDDGGALRLFDGAETIDVVPHGGTLVAFPSDATEHEVQPSRRARLSIAGWFRRRSLRAR